MASSPRRAVTVLFPGQQLDCNDLSFTEICQPGDLIHLQQRAASNGLAQPTRTLGPTRRADPWLSSDQEPGSRDQQPELGSWQMGCDCPSDNQCGALASSRRKQIRPTLASGSELSCPGHSGRSYLAGLQLESPRERRICFSNQPL